MEIVKPLKAKVTALVPMIVAKITARDVRDPDHILLVLQTALATQNVTGKTAVLLKLVVRVKVLLQVKHVMVLAVMPAVVKELLR